MKGNYFSSNSADNAGGALKWTTIEPEMSEQTFDDNSAKLYGDNIAAIP